LAAKLPSTPHTGNSGCRRERNSLLSTAPVQLHSNPLIFQLSLTILCLFRFFMATEKDHLAEEARCVRNFLEDYWQFNEIDADKVKSARALKPDLPLSEPVRVFSNKHYFSGYGPHNFDSCALSCQVPSSTPRRKARKQFR
jgi:hypothetical protein